MKKVLFKIYRLPIPWRVRRFISLVLSFFVFPRKNHIGTVDEYFTSNFDKLVNDGYLIIHDFLSESKVETLKSKLLKFKVYNPWDKNSDYFNSDNPPIGTHIGAYQKSDILSIGEINDIVNSPILNAFISKYIGNNFKCTNVAAWWTFGNNHEPEEAELFHRDLDNILWLKVFIYLTDVDSYSGPHAFIKESHRSLKMLTFKRFSDIDAKNIFGEIVYHTGKKGTLIIEDTFGLHKGQHISENSNRLILQLQYSIFNNPY
jgi:hypothetical protein